MSAELSRISEIETTNNPGPSSSGFDILCHLYTIPDAEEAFRVLDDDIGVFENGGALYEDSEAKFLKILSEAQGKPCPPEELDGFADASAQNRKLTELRVVAGQISRIHEQQYSKEQEGNKGSLTPTQVALLNYYEVQYGDRDQAIAAFTTLAIHATRRQAGTALAVRQPQQPIDAFEPVNNAIGTGLAKAAGLTHAWADKGLKVYDALADRIQEINWRKPAAVVIALALSAGSGNATPITTQQLNSDHRIAHDEPEAIHITAEADPVLAVVMPVALTEAPTASEKPRITTASEALVEVIKESESWKPNLYNDPAGNATIGFGHLVKESPVDGTEPEEFKQGLTEEQGLELLQQDIAHFERVVAELVTVPLRQHQFDALVSFAYNVGGGAFERSDLLEHLNQGSYEKVAEMLMEWVHANGEKMGGLVNRRIDEVEFWNCEPTVLEAAHADSEPENDVCGDLLKAGESEQITIVEVEGIKIREEFAPNLAALLEAARAAGLELTANSDYRDRHDQWKLRVENCPDPVNSRPSDCTPDTGYADNPYTPELEGSDHQRGEAVDFRVNGIPLHSREQSEFQRLEEIAFPLGVVANVPSEPWHFKFNKSAQEVAPTEPVT